MTSVESSPASGNYVPPKNIPSYIRNEVDAFAQRADDLASQILNNGSDTTVRGDAPVIIHHYHTPWVSYFYNPFWTPRPVYVVGYRRDNRDEALRLLIGMIGTVIGAIAIAAVGAAYSRVRDANRELNDAEALREKMSVYKNTTTENDKIAYIAEVNRLIDKKVEVCSRIKNSAIMDLILRIGVAASACLAVVGAVALLPGYFMTAGVVAATAFAMCMLFKLAMESKRADIEDAGEIHRMVSNLAQF